MQSDGRRNKIVVYKLTTGQYVAQFEQFDPKGNRIHTGRSAVGDNQEQAIEALIGAEGILYRHPNVLQHAEQLVMGPRRETYGHPFDNHSRTADLWNAYIRGLKGPGMTANDVCALNILQKLSRLQNSPDHMDSISDIAGFALNMQLIQEERKRQQKQAQAQFESRKLSDAEREELEQLRERYKAEARLKMDPPEKAPEGSSNTVKLKLYRETQDASLDEGLVEYTLDDYIKSTDDSIDPPLNIADEAAARLGYAVSYSIAGDGSGLVFARAYGFAARSGWVEVLKARGADKEGAGRSLGKQLILRLREALKTSEEPKVDKHADTESPGPAPIVKNFPDPQS